MSSKYLVSGHEDFLDQAQMDTGARVLLGDEHTDPDIGVDIVNAHIALKQGVRKVAALAHDESRNDVERHAAAKKVADQVVDHLTKTKSMIQKRAETLMREGTREADLEFAPTSDKGALHSEIRSWIRDTLARPDGDGLVRVREAMKGSKDIAAVVHHSPRYLLNLPEDVHQKLQLDAIEAHTPEAYAKLNTSVDLQDLLQKYDSTIRRVTVSFYNHALADKFKNRVAV